MAREATWRNVGTAVDTCTDYHAVLQAAGLDYRVVKKPGRIRVDGKEVRTGDFYTMRKGDPHHIYGRVSEKYQIVQNETAFSLVDYIGEDLSFLKAAEKQHVFGRHGLCDRKTAGNRGARRQVLPEPNHVK